MLFARSEQGGLFVRDKDRSVSSDILLPSDQSAEHYLAMSVTGTLLDNASDDVSGRAAE